MPRSVVLVALLGCTSPPVTAPVARPQAVTAPAPAASLLPTPSYLTSTRIAATDRGAFVIDADSGMLVKTDRDGAVIARLAIGHDAGMLAHDPARSAVYVADRAGDRLVVVDVATMRVSRSWKTPAEPFGVALSPDGATVHVTTIADRLLVAYDASSGTETWRAPLSAEPRAVAVAPDGKRALITLNAGSLDEVALDGAHPVTSLVLDLTCDRCADGPAFARGSSVVFLDQHRAIASFQRAVPEALELIRASVYGGGTLPPVTQHLSFLSFTPTRGQVVAQIVANQPRSILWDRGRDTLFVAGLASDTILRLAGLTNGTTDDVDAGAKEFAVGASNRCGPDGVAQAADGTVYVWCSFSRTVLRIPVAAGEVRESSPVADSVLPPDQHAGFVLFHGVHRGINHDGALACSTCHTDGRADGLSWKIQTETRQTPMLAGRMVGTHPYKWDGSDRTIRASLFSTITRLGGSGLSPDQTTALVAYLEALPRPRPPTLDPAAVARGKAVFTGAGDCVECHSGPRFTDGKQHRFESTLERADTPSLIGLSASAPYYHDGSAPTLDALVRGAGNVHGMADMSALTAEQRADLAMFLSSL